MSSTDFAILTVHNVTLHEDRRLASRPARVAIKHGSSDDGGNGPSIKSAGRGGSPAGVAKGDTKAEKLGTTGKSKPWKKATVKPKDEREANIPRPTNAESNEPTDELSGTMPRWKQDMLKNKTKVGANAVSSKEEGSLQGLVTT
jgi:hypothetical protein